MVSKPQAPKAEVWAGARCSTFHVAGRWGKPCEVGPGSARPAHSCLPGWFCLPSLCPRGKRLPGEGAGW